jgi:hypothetical protein
MQLLHINSPILHHEGEAQAAGVYYKPPGQSLSTPPAPTRLCPAAPTVRGYLDVPIVRVHPAAPIVRAHPAAPTS